MRRLGRGFGIMRGERNASIVVCLVVRAVTIGGEEIGDETTIVEQMQKMQKQREHEEKIVSRPMFTSRYTFL